MKVLPCPCFVFHINSIYFEYCYCFLSAHLFPGFSCEYSPWHSPLTSAAPPLLIRGLLCFSLSVYTWLQVTSWVIGSLLFTPVHMYAFPWYPAGHLCLECCVTSNNTSRTVRLSTRQRDGCTLLGVQPGCRGCWTGGDEGSCSPLMACSYCNTLVGDPSGHISIYIAKCIWSNGSQTTSAFMS